VIMHATHNGVIQAFFDAITIKSSVTSWFTGEFGIALVPFAALVALYCWRHSDEIKSYVSAGSVTNEPAYHHGSPASMRA